MKMNEFAGRSKLGPREKGRKNKGKRRPQAVRDARQRRKALLRAIEARLTP